MRIRIWLACVALAVGGCVRLPTAPNVNAMPAPYKPFDVFTTEDARCRDFAARRVELGGEQARRQATEAAVAGAVGGAVVGGLVTGSPRGVATGGGIGLLMGAIAGLNASEWNSWNLQRRYDWSYEQCMYANGNQLPGYAPLSVPPPPPPPPPREPPRK